MNTIRTLAATLALALAAPGAALAQAGHAHGHAGTAQTAPGEGAMPGGMMGGAMPAEMQQAMQAHMQEVMRPMLREIMAEIMAGMPGSAPGAAGDPHAHHAAASGGSPATQAYRAANDAMHAAMDIPFTDDADIDFARGMIGHHEGAIAMARIVLEHGEDPALHDLAREIIAAQEAEIAFLQDWLAEHAE